MCVEQPLALPGSAKYLYMDMDMDIEFSQVKFKLNSKSGGVSETRYQRLFEYFKIFWKISMFISMNGHKHDLKLFFLNCQV